MKLSLSRLYSIQAKLGAILLIAILVILCGGAGSLFLSNRFLLISQLFVRSSLPKMQVATALQQTTFRLSGFTREVARGEMQQHLQERYGELTGALDQVEALTAKISQEESVADILTFNYLSQAIRNQASIVFQVQVQLARRTEQLQGSLADLRNELSVISEQVAPWQPAGGEEASQGHLAGLVQELITVVDKLAIDTRRAELQRLHEFFAISAQRLATFTATSQDSDSNSQRASQLSDIAQRLEPLFTLKGQLIDAASHLEQLVLALGDLTSRLEQLTASYIESVFHHFYDSAGQIAGQIKQDIGTTLVLGIASILMLCLLHWVLVVRGLGGRLSQISRAMGSAFAERAEWHLPVEGRDEIADMARSAAQLLHKADQLRELATIDALTKIDNRRRFFELADKEVKRAARTGETAVVLMLDIDHFKQINDTHGHDFGDRVLRETAQACKQITREIDIFARYGGEEFVLLMPDTPLVLGINAAQRLLKAVASLAFFSQGQAVGVSVSIGLAEAALAVTTMEEALKRADIALYQAKAGGRNRIEVYRSDT